VCKRQCLRYAVKIKLAGLHRLLRSCTREAGVLFTEQSTQGVAFISDIHVMQKIETHWSCTSTVGRQMALCGTRLFIFYHRCDNKFVIEEITLLQNFLLITSVFRESDLPVFPYPTHLRVSAPPVGCVSPNQATHYHLLSL